MSENQLNQDERHGLVERGLEISLWSRVAGDRFLQRLVAVCPPRV
ncbi:MAG: hypothetical protein NT069_23520 [Planctomycetota bacterium]|nr:hypothetical protein [Planctomycetota bacterium]